MINYNPVPQFIQIFIILYLFLYSNFSYSQNGVAINTTGVSADLSAILDISSNDAGILIPRLTENQKNSIQSPALGLMIFQTDGLNPGLWFFNGTHWVQSVGSNGTTGATGPTGATGADAFLPSGSSLGNTPFWDGSQWVVNSSNIFNDGVSVGIGTNSPNSSAVLDISSNNRGTLITRLTEIQRNSINSPANGLMIYNTTSRCFEYFEYGIWQTMNCAICPMPDTAKQISGSSSVCLGDINVAYSVPLIKNATNYIWEYSGTGVNINGASDSITIDFLINATSGELTVKGNNFCGDGVVSSSFNINVNSIPNLPITATHNVQQTEIQWNWNVSSGATGYKYSTINDYSQAIDNGTNTSYMQTGLTCENDYTLYVWAYNFCGYSDATELTATTANCFVCGISNITFNYFGSDVTYGTVVGQNGTCWLDRNLGASSFATSVSHTASYGDLFQWGRAVDGHQIRTSASTSTISGTDNPGHDKSIASSSTYNNDWRSPKNDNLWQGVNGINNPCPTGWRIPTNIEFDNERLSWSPNNYDGALSSPLKFTPAGYRLFGAPVDQVGSIGYYWTSSVLDYNAYRIHFTSSNTEIGDRGRSMGASVRCIKN